MYLLPTGAVSAARALGMEQAAHEASCYLAAQQQRLETELHAAANRSAAAFAAAVDDAIDAGVPRAAIACARAAFAATCRTALAALHDAAAHGSAADVISALYTVECKGGHGNVHMFLQRRRAVAQQLVDELARGNQANEPSLDALVAAASNLGLQHVPALVQTARKLLTAVSSQPLKTGPSLEISPQTWQHVVAAWRAASERKPRHRLVCGSSDTVRHVFPAAAPPAAVPPPLWLMRVLRRAAHGASLPTVRLLNLTHQRVGTVQGLSDALPALHMLDVSGNHLTTLQGLGVGWGTE